MDFEALYLRIFHEVSFQIVHDRFCFFSQLDNAMSILTLKTIDTLAIIFKVIEAELLLELGEIACDFESLLVFFVCIR